MSKKNIIIIGFLVEKDNFTYSGIKIKEKNTNGDKLVTLAISGEEKVTLATYGEKIVTLD